MLLPIRLFMRLVQDRDASQDARVAVRTNRGPTLNILLGAPKAFIFKEVENTHNCPAQLSCPEAAAVNLALLK